MPRPGNQTSADPLMDRALPSNLDAERSVLASILIDNSLCHQAIELLKPDEFYRESHRRIYDRMRDLSGRGMPIDIVTLSSELTRAGELEQVGGPAFLASLLDTGVPLSNLEAHAKLIKEQAMLRRMILVCRKGMETCFEQEDDPETIIDRIEKDIFEIGEERIRTGFIPVSEIAHHQLQRIEEAAGRPEMLTGLSTGFADLDRMTNGLQPSDLIIVAARPSMGKTSFCLNIAENVSTMDGKSVGVFSLEMSKESLVTRLLCSQGRVDAQRMRGGFLNKDEWNSLAAALETLAQSRIFIDDTPGITVMEMRAKARRLKAQYGLDLLIVDYLQLISGKGRAENRQTEVSQISRDLKALAKELHVPVIALSQLSRASESRSDHRPMLSDLRESGCLTGDTLVTLADTGAEVPIRDLVGKSGFAVWALNEATFQIVRANASRAFSTGIKPVFRLTTKLGRSIRATANHKFRTFAGWKRLDELQVGERLAMPRFVPSSERQTMTNAELALLGHLIGDGCTLPRHAIQYTTRELDLAETVATLAVEVFGDAVSPRIRQERQWFQVYLASSRHHTHNVRSAVTEWLEPMGIFGLRSFEKFIPSRVFEQPKEAIALFLRHLWATDGCIAFKSVTQGKYPAIYYASSSERLASDVQSLLLRLGINARLARVSQNGKGRDQFHVILSGKPDFERFGNLIGAVGTYKNQRLDEIKHFLEKVSGKTNRDILPREIWVKLINPFMRERNLQPTTLGKFRTTFNAQHTLSRERAQQIAEILCSIELAQLAQSDIYWDEIVSIEPAGEEAVYDLTVDVCHNFIAAKSFPHNSIEQDADVVGFIYREEMYGQTDENNGVAELIIAKQRNGPTGVVPLAFIKAFTRFENMWREG